MSDSSKIEWTDATWNPVTGCTKVSPGCDHCYAETFAERWRGTPGHHFENGFDVTLRPERLEQPFHWKRPRRIFVNSMSDVFHEAVPDDFIARMFAVMAECPQHTFQVLTKRHARMRSLLTRLVFKPPPNIWLGVSVEDQKWADIRIPALIETPAAIRFLSCEPLLGPVDLGIGDPHRGHESDEGWGFPHPRVCLTCSGPDGENEEDEVEYFRRDYSWPAPVDWVIIGGESGPGARPMSPTWARSLVRECQDASVPVFVKQLGAALGRGYDAGRKGGDWDHWPADLKVRQFPLAAESVTA